MATQVPSQIINFLLYHKWSSQVLRCHLCKSLWRGRASIGIITFRLWASIFMYTSTETTEQRPTEFIKVYKNLEERSTIFSSVQAFFRNEYQPRLDDIASTFIEFIGRTVSQRTAVYYAFPYCVRILHMMRSWSCPPDCSLFFLFLLASFYSSLEITLLLHHGHTSAFPSN